MRIEHNASLLTESQAFLKSKIVDILSHSASILQYLTNAENQM
jgi:hypothetical protein